jgi:hypothetical protein
MTDFALHCQFNFLQHTVIVCRMATQSPKLLFCSNSSVFPHLNKQENYLYSAKFDISTTAILNSKAYKDVTLYDKVSTFWQSLQLHQETVAWPRKWKHCCCLSTGNCSPTDTAPHPTRLETSASPLYEILRFSGWWALWLVTWNMVSIMVNRMKYGNTVSGMKYGEHYD